MTAETGATRGEIVLHDVARGGDEIVFATEALIEAPNWSPDGAFLVVNGDGRLYRLDLDVPCRAPDGKRFAYVRYARGGAAPA